MIKYTKIIVNILAYLHCNLSVVFFNCVQKVTNYTVTNKVCMAKKIR